MVSEVIFFSTDNIQKGIAYSHTLVHNLFAKFTSKINEKHKFENNYRRSAHDRPILHRGLRFAYAAWTKIHNSFSFWPKIHNWMFCMFLHHTCKVFYNKYFSQSDRRSIRERPMLCHSLTCCVHLFSAYVLNDILWLKDLSFVTDLTKI